MIIPGRMRGLVVDDNTYARAIAGASLKKLGINDITEAESGAEAILALLSMPFDFVLMDWYMPEISGAGLLRVLRDSRFGPAANTPVVLMTGYASRDNIATARQLGVNEVLVKPFTTAQLGTAIGRVLGQAKQVSSAESTYL